MQQYEVILKRASLNIIVKVDILRAEYASCLLYSITFVMLYKSPRSTYHQHGMFGEKLSGSAQLLLNT